MKGYDRLALNRSSPFALPALSLVAAGALCGCSIDSVPSGLKRPTAGSGPVVRFALTPESFDIPMPNDVLASPDPTSRTGLRLNFSLAASSSIERDVRLELNQLEGWGTFATISVAFDKTKTDDVRPALDLGKVVQLHQSDHYDFADDAVYLVNLQTGTPVPLDLGQGSFSYILKDKAQYFPNDPKRFEPVLLWETADETIDTKDAKFAPARTRDGTVNAPTNYRPEWDNDFDGILDRPNLLNRNACPSQVDVELAGSAAREALETLRDQCLADHLLSWYERETDTLLIRPLLALDERTEYAVVLTDRLQSPDGDPVRSPFNFVYHPSQASGLTRLRAHLSDGALSAYYGDIGGTGLEHVAFAWTFTTQSVTDDLHALREGLHGSGSLARLGGQSEAVQVLRAVGLVDLDTLEQGGSEPDDWQEQSRCRTAGPSQVAVAMSEVGDALGQLVDKTLDLRPGESATLAETWRSISHVTLGSFESPQLLRATGTGASFDHDVLYGKRDPTQQRVTFLTTIPKARAGMQQPFPVVFYAHGHGRSFIESLLFAGTLAEQGLATVSINAALHGVSLDSETQALLEEPFTEACAAPFRSAIFRGRARDTNQDGRLDSGSGWYDARAFRTRDLVRQGVIDALQLFRSLQTLEASGAADFDGNGTADLSANLGLFAWGQSTGGAIATIATAIDPSVSALTIGSSSAGLADVLATTSSSSIVSEALSTILGPLTIGTPASELLESGRATGCQSGQVSLRFVVSAPERAEELEFACLDPVEATAGRGLASGGTVLLTNGENGNVRCARMDKDGRFRLSIATSVGDRLEVQVWDRPDAVDSYHPENGCNISDPTAQRIALINTWHLPAGYRGQEFVQNARLLAPADGLGRQRQTPSLRRFLDLANHVFSAADPASFAPLVSLGRAGARPKAILSYVTAGDAIAPVTTGIALARALGLVPFLRPGSDTTYPAHAEFVTPPELFSQLANETPDRLLIETHVLEGIARLKRHPPTESCGRNEVPVSNDDFFCHAPCAADDTSSCLPEQHCVSGRCEAIPVDAAQCADFLFDVDALSEGASGLNQRQSPLPLRLARVAAHELDPVKIWQPSLRAQPFSDDAVAWPATEPLLAHVHAYIDPLGSHGLGAPEPCAQFPHNLYMARLVARFFATRGHDIYYLSHPSTHHCLVGSADDQVCAFLTP